MLKVLLVDDEPFIVKGLSVLIDWEQEGFEIAGVASNGEEALKFLQKEKVDLIIADIKMPVMTGLELLEYIRTHQVSDAYFVILSGYADFSYAQKALRYECFDYILKPVKKDALTTVIRKVSQSSIHVEQQKKDAEKMEQAYLARNTISLLQGNYDQLNMEYVQKHMRLSDEVRYIEIQLYETAMEENITDEEKRSCQRKCYEVCLEFLGDDACHCVFDVSGHEKIYDIGFIYCDYMAKQKGITESEYLRSFLDYLQERTEMPIVMLAGKVVNGIANIAKSYGTSCMLRSIQGFRMKKDIYYYEQEVHVSTGGILLCKNSLDALLAAIEQNNRVEIKKSVEAFYEEMQQMDVNGDVMTLNINYLLFQLIHLAVQQDDKVNQEEIIRLIGESSFEQGFKRGSKAHLSRFSCEYADYLAQLRKSMSRGVLAQIDREIKEHYAQNLTLKGLSEKYFVNSAYLGQLFRKKYGQSFKDYLNNYRMEQAAIKLVRTDDKIYQIAEQVGYHDLDYFVNRFILAKGCTPAKFRKQANSSEKG